MPQAFAIAAFAAEAAGASSLIVGALTLTGAALSYQQAKKAKRKARDEFNAAQVDRLANVTSTVGPRELVMGRSRKGGNVFFRGSTGTNKTVFVMCIALAGHEIDAVEQVYFNDVPVTLDGSGNVTTSPYSITQTGSYTETLASGANTLVYTPITGTLSAHTGVPGPNGDLHDVAYTLVGNVLTLAENATVQYQYTYTAVNANVRAYLGAAGQTADARLMTLFPGQWTAAHRAQGVAYLICEFRYDETSFPSGLPNVTAVIRGAKLYDPRTTLTAWSDNPALMMRYAYAHPFFGKGAPTAEEDARITIAANACDASQGYVVAGVTTTVAKYRAGIVAPFGTDCGAVLDDLAQAMAGAWAFAGGQLYVKAGVFTASVMSLADADLAVITRNGVQETMHPISIAVHRERAQKFNTVNVQIWDAGQDYKQVSLTPLDDGTGALVARDGAVLAQGVSYAAIGFAPQALHVASVMMRDARDPLTVVIPLKLRAYPVELFDTVDITLTRYGWSGKLFMVVARDWTSEGFLQLTLKETSSAIYAVDAAFRAQGYAANTNLPNPWYVAPIGTLTVTSGTAELLLQADGTILTRMRVSWPPIDDSSVNGGGQVEVQYRSVLSSGAWESVSVNGAETQALISGVQDGLAYNIRARARNRNAVGQWSMQVTHLVLGKDELPSTVAGVALTQELALWTVVADIDVIGYELRAIPGSVAIWSLGVALHEGLVTSSPYRFEQRLTGVQTVMVAAKDRSGNLGVPGSATLDFGVIDEFNVAQTYDYAANGYPGPLTTNASVSGGYLVADIDPSVDWWAVGGADGDWWGYAGGADFWGGSLYLAMQYVSTFAPNYSAGSVILDATLVGAPSTIEWRTDGGTLGDYWDIVPGGSDFWADGADMYGVENAWQPYIGEVVSVADQGIQWRVSIGAGPVQGEITAMSVRLQMPQLSQVFTDLTIDAGGTRLGPSDGNPAVSWIRVEQVDFTVYVDGSGAVAGRVLDFDPDQGPLVQTINAAGTPVTSTGQSARASGF